MNESEKVTETIEEEHKETAKTMDEEYNPEKVKKNRWSEFIEDRVLDFFDAYKLEKLAIEDDNGNKAKISRTKDSVKIETSSITIL